jgi:DMSO/TMAO reductase YedYZ molybdopterin-dependent catalytic subunit
VLLLGLKDLPKQDGRFLANVEFINEGTPVMDAAFGEELDGRQYTSLGDLRDDSAPTPAERFYVRTRASAMLPSTASWKVELGGLVKRPHKIALERLKTRAVPCGRHLMECAGNTRAARFGMLSVGEWAGVPLAELINEAGVTAKATCVEISGFDRYSKPSATSTPGASWIFSMTDLQSTNAFLALELNGKPLAADHGAPVRLVVPGWYGCTCIKWVDRISVVGDGAESTSQMLEYAGRTAQQGAPRLARDYRPARIEFAAIPIRIEKWELNGKIQYHVIGIAWGGTEPVDSLRIRFNPEEEFVPVENYRRRSSLNETSWTLWSHTWTHAAPGTYTIRLAAGNPAVKSRRLESGYYARTVKIADA